jgi:hypothetical protein
MHGHDGQLAQVTIKDSNKETLPLLKNNIDKIQRSINKLQKVQIEISTKLSSIIPYSEPTPDKEYKDMNTNPKPHTVEEHFELVNDGFEYLLHKLEQCSRHLNQIV